MITKYFLLFLFLAGFALASCQKNNNPAPTTKDSAFISPAAADSATGIVLVTYSAKSLCFWTVYGWASVEWELPESAERFWGALSLWKKSLSLCL